MTQFSSDLSSTIGIGSSETFVVETHNTKSLKISMKADDSPYKVEVFTSQTHPSQASFSISDYQSILSGGHTTIEDTELHKVSTDSVGGSTALVVSNESDSSIELEGEIQRLTSTSNSTASFFNVESTDKGSYYFLDGTMVSNIEELDLSVLNGSDIESSESNLYMESNGSGGLDLRRVRGYNQVSTVTENYESNPNEVVLANSQSAIVNSVGNDIRGVEFDDSGLLMFELSLSGVVYEFDLEDPYYLPSANPTGKSFSVEGSDSTGFAFDSNGLRLFTSSPSDSRIYEHTLTEPFDVSTASYTGNSISTQDSSVLGIELSDDDRYLFEISNDVIYQYDLNPSFSLETSEYRALDNLARDNTLSMTASGFTFAQSGSTLYTVNSSTIEQYSLSEDYKLATASFETSLSDSTNTSDLTDLFITPNGSNVIVSDRDEGRFSLFDLDSSFDISSGTFEVTTLDVTLPEPSEADFVTVKKVDTTNNIVTVSTPNQETIDGQVRFDLQTPYSAREFISDGSDYYVI